MLADYPNVDGVIPLVHGTGCGMASKGEGFETLMRTEWGYAANPNVGATLMIGLGCEVFQIGRMKEEYEVVEGDQFQSLTIQATGGTRKTIEAGLERIRAMLPKLDQARREPQPASALTLALQCGGSDGYSGITANPALGAAVDMLVRNGGTAILSETPEIYGAEHLLTRRAATPDIGRRLLERIHWWEDYCARNGGEMNNNPSPGNKAGGLTTILEKSLGAAAKGGTTPLMAVYKYAEPVTAKGFVFMDTPGYDPVSATGQVAGGANMLCFTTGPRLGLRLQADAFDQARDQQRRLSSHDRRHGHQLRRRARRRDDRREGAGDLRQHPRGRVGRADEVRDARLRGGRVHALADRSDDVTAKGAALLFDLDGTLIDSDAKHLAAFQRSLRFLWDHGRSGVLQREHPRRVERTDRRGCFCRIFRPRPSAPRWTRRRPPTAPTSPASRGLPERSSFSTSPNDSEWASRW